MITQRPAPGAGLCFHTPATSSASVRRGILATVCAITLGVMVACGDEAGVWSRYELQRSFFEIQQDWAQADLQAQAGQEVDLRSLEERMLRALEGFNTLRPQLEAADSMILVMAAQSRLRLGDIYKVDRSWDRADEQYRLVVGDSLFPVQFRHLALMNRGRLAEEQYRFVDAAAQYRALLESFYPPVGEGGINRDVLVLPVHLLEMAAEHVPDSLPVWRTFTASYYDGLAGAFPGTGLGVEALGQLGRAYARGGEWQLAMQTLERARDSSGAIVPAYHIDIAEIRATELGDTAGALKIYADIAAADSTSPFRADADLKAAAIWMRRGRYDRVQSITSRLKDDFEDRASVVVSAQLLYAGSFDAQGNWDRARAEYGWLVNMIPQSLQAIEAALRIARHDREAGETASSVKWYNQADQLAADLLRTDRVQPAVAGTAMDYRVAAAIEQGKWDDAVSLLNDIVRTFSPDSPPGALALVRLGWLHLSERADTAAAGAAWQRFLDVYPDHPQSETLRREIRKWPEHFKTNMSS